MYRSSRLALVGAATASALLAGCSTSDSGDDGNTSAGGSSPLPGLVQEVQDLRDDVLAGEIPSQDDEYDEYDDWDDTDDQDPWDDPEDLDNWDDAEDLEEPDLDDYEQDDLDDLDSQGEELHGVWTGDDGSIFGVVMASESETILPTTHYLAPEGNPETDECIGILLGTGEAGWNTSFICDGEDTEEADFVRIEESGEQVDITWLDDNLEPTNTITYSYVGGWDD